MSSRPSRGKRPLVMNLSPKFLNQSDAVNLKRARQAEIAGESKESSLQETEALEGDKENEVLVSPKATNGNVTYEKVKKLTQSLKGINLRYLNEYMEKKKKEKLYTKFVGASRQTCEYDLITFVLKVLDFYTLKAFKEDEQQMGPLLIPTVIADESDVRYLSLGNALDSGCLYPQHIPVVKDIMSRAEDFMLDYINLPRSKRPTVRKQCTQLFSSSTLREDILFSTHVFSSVLATSNIDYMSPSPPLKAVAMNFFCERTLRFTALRALVLKDLETHFSADALDEDYDMLYQCGLLFFKKLMAQHAPFSLKVSFGSLEVEVLRDGDTSEDIDVIHTYELRNVNYGELSIAGAT